MIPTIRKYLVAALVPFATSAPIGSALAGGGDEPDGRGIRVTDEEYQANAAAITRFFTQSPLSHIPLHAEIFVTSLSDAITIFPPALTDVREGKRQPSENAPSPLSNVFPSFGNAFRWIDTGLSTLDVAITATAPVMKAGEEIVSGTVGATNALFQDAANLVTTGTVDGGFRTTAYLQETANNLLRMPIDIVLSTISFASDVTSSLVQTAYYPFDRAHTDPTLGSVAIHPQKQMSSLGERLSQAATPTHR